MSAGAERRRPRTTARGGFTLPELLVAMAGAGLVLAGLVTFLVAGQQSFLVGANQIEAQQNVRIAIARLTDEIRGAGNGRPPRSPGDDPPPPPRPPAIAAGQTATSFTVQNDWNGNGTIDQGVVVTVNGSLRGEQVTYSFAGGQLLRRESAVDNAAQPIVGGIQGLVVTYLDASGTETATPEYICSVVVTVQTRPETRQAATYQQGGVVVTMTDTARIRNPGCEQRSGA